MTSAWKKNQIPCGMAQLNSDNLCWRGVSFLILTSSRGGLTCLSTWMAGPLDNCEGSQQQTDLHGSPTPGIHTLVLCWPINHPWREPSGRDLWAFWRTVTLTSYRTPEDRFCWQLDELRNSSSPLEPPDENAAQPTLCVQHVGPWADKAAKPGPDCWPRNR